MNFARSLVTVLLGFFLVAGFAGEGKAAMPILLAQAPAPSGGDANAPAASAPAPAQPADTFSIRSRGYTKEADGSMNLWQVLQNGGWAMYPLGLFSVVTFMLIIVYLFTLRRGAILSAHYMNTADVLLKKRDQLGLLAISSRHSEVIARVVQRTLDFATKHPNVPFDSIRDIAETEGAAQSASLQHRITYLADIAVLSPMVGLLGTVVGIIRAFAKLGSGEASISRDILLASGVSEALIATATGLILGVVSMFFYSIFRNRVHSLISDLEIATAHIMGLLAIQHGKKPSRVPVEEEF